MTILKKAILSLPIPKMALLSVVVYLQPFRKDPIYLSLSHISSRYSPLAGYIVFLASPFSPVQPGVWRRAWSVVEPGVRCSPKPEPRWSPEPRAAGARHKAWWSLQCSVDPKTRSPERGGARSLVEPGAQWWSPGWSRRPEDAEFGEARIKFGGARSPVESGACGAPNRPAVFSLKPGGGQGPQPAPWSPERMQAKQL